MKKFPEGFYWGAATASYQVEGGIENNDWAKSAREGRVPVCGRACDQYHRFEKDFDLAKELGHTAHRFSVEWARIEPEEGKFNREAIEHYREVLAALNARDIKPFVTIWHFTLPLWFSESGGFERRDAPEIFARYAAFVVRELGDLCDHFSTMNEPNVFATQGWVNGEWPPFKVSRKPWQRSYTGTVIKKRTKIFTLFSYFRVMTNLVKAHNFAYKKIKVANPDCLVSYVKHIHVYLKPTGVLNKVRAVLSDYFQNHRFTRRTYKYVDEIGVNYYQASQYGIELTDKKTDMGWNFTPEYIYEALMLLSRYKKPLFVSEGGLADHDDSDRAEYIKKQVAATWQAMQDGADVRGHLYWSLMDNYEWALGFEKRFGLIEVNYDTLERKIRPSAYVYKEIIERNAVME
ncbi:glycoside hydrolase family 1 protein [Candidatus Kaiserbacteria bacterium]|nr:glycoside hydrolase family 1 protein [Candidatus Kaiserbacteria bacterium]